MIIDTLKKNFNVSSCATVHVYVVHMSALKLIKFTQVAILSCASIAGLLLNLAQRR